MKINILISLSLIAAAAQADPIEMGWIQNGDENLPIRHFLPRNPNVSNILSVEKEDTSILIEYRGSDFTELGVRVKDEDGQVIYEDMTSEATLQLPLPDSGYYTIEVRVDDSLYYGEFSVE
jgi:hypothetical protein